MDRASTLDAKAGHPGQTDSSHFHWTSRKQHTHESSFRRQRNTLRKADWINSQLKAQIVRIDHSTEIVPSNRYKVNLENEEEEGLPEPEKVDPEEMKELSLEQLSKLGNWVHFPPAILKQGTLKHAEIENDDEDIKKKLMDEQAASDPYSQRLLPISQDKCSISLTEDCDLPSGWIVRIHGDMTKRIHPYKPVLVDTAYLSIRSLIWPGLMHMVTPVF
jgi:hypothetical protein